MQILLTQDYLWKGRNEMKKIKKIFLLMLCVGVLGSMTACGTNKGTTNGTTDTTDNNKVNDKNDTAVGDDDNDGVVDDAVDKATDKVDKAADDLTNDNGAAKDNLNERNSNDK